MVTVPSRRPRAANSGALACTKPRSADFTAVSAGTVDPYCGI
jgi:hypothetical protein